MKKTKQEVCHRYKMEYVTRLNNRPKNRTLLPNLKVDQLVLVREEASPSCEWPLGRIVATFPGSDGLVRVVDVKTATGIKRRSLNNNCPLPSEVCDNSAL